jgi:RHS repeat-associated protein
MAIKTGNINSLRVKGFARRSLFIETLPGRKKVMFYDNRYRLIQTQGNNHLNTVLADVNTSVPDFTGKPLITKVIKVAASITTTVQTTYTYDQANRLLALDQSYNGAAAMRVAAYEYNEMGQLVRKNLNSLSGTGNIPGNVTLDGSTQFPGNSLTVTAGIITLKPGFATPPGATVVLKSASYLQSLDYRYNIRGQLTNINNSTLTNDGVTNSDSNDLFGMQIMYEQQDANLGNTGYYNGMVSAVKWMSRDASGNSSNERSYVYAYDQTMQLTGSSYAERTAGSSGTFNVNQGAFNENGISYDENGNITTLARNAVQSGGSIVQVDNLQYTYDQTNNPNRLLSVTDGTGSNYTGYGFKNLTGNTSSTYQYDANGNMTSDPYKGLSTTYNILNRTDKITITTATNRYLTYTYDATGTLLRKQQFDNGTLQTTTDYSEGFVFTTAGTGSAALAYFGMPEGRIRNNGGTLKAEYIITDQQGNARISFEDNGSGKAVVRQETSYYAFGLTIPGSAVTTPSAPNKNLYNGGSEWQNDYGNLPDYQQTFYRNYDAALGRWVAVDPMAESAESMTSYQYAGDNPIMMNDPMGDLLDPNKTSTPANMTPASNPFTNCYSQLGIYGTPGGPGMQDDGAGNTGGPSDLGSNNIDYSDFWGSFLSNANNYLQNGGGDVHITGGSVSSAYNNFSRSGYGGITSALINNAADGVSNTPVQGNLLGQVNVTPQGTFFPAGWGKASQGGYWSSLDWKGIGDATIGMLGGAGEIATASAAEVGSEGLSTAVSVPLAIDGWGRVGTNFNRLAAYFGGNKALGDALPSNIGGYVGKTVDVFSGVDFYSTGKGQAILGGTNDLLLIISPYGNAGAWESVLGKPNLWNSVGLGVSYYGGIIGLKNDVQSLPKR